MIVYLDTSAFVPLLVEEPTSDRCGQLWDDADRLVTTRLTYVEAAAALTMAERIGRISRDEHEAGHRRLVELWPEVDVLELDKPLMQAAAAGARRHGLRGCDSVHLAAASTLDDDELVAGAGDGRLLEAWRAEGLQVFDTNPPQLGAS